MSESSNKIESFIGKEFEYCADGPDKFDCWNIVAAYLAANGLQIPTQESVVNETLRHLRIRQVADEHFERIEQPEPLSIVLFKLKPPMVTHMGVILEDGERFLHIMAKRRSVVERLDSRIWSRRIEGYYRFMGA